MAMRTTGKGRYYCAGCGFDCTPTKGEPGVADETCPAADGDFCIPKKRVRVPKAESAAKRNPKKRTTIKVDVVEGAAGLALYFDDYRAGGLKPLGGGTILHSFRVARQDVVDALAHVGKTTRETREAAR